MMSRLLLALLVSAVGLTAVVLAQSPADENGIQPSDWPSWRGPHADGVATSTGDVTTQWSDGQNVLWRTSVPGRGHGSATVLGDQVFLPTALDEPQQQLVVSFDRETGKQLWKTVVHEGGFANRGGAGNDKASRASSTIATDGSRLFINFLHDNAVWTTAISLDGKILWQKKISDYVLHQGYGSSPLVHGPLVIVSADNKGGGAVAGLDRETGQAIWNHSRPSMPNYSSPVIVDVGGKNQLIMTGCEIVESLDPLTGDVLWKIDGATTECVTSTVTDGRLVVSSGGYPKNHIAAYAADSNGELIWENRLRCYVPSMVAHDGFLYAVMDEGIAICMRFSDGKVQWKERLGGTFTSSLVLVDKNIFASSEEGVTHIFEANADEFKRIGENQLGTSVFASPAIAGNQLFLRVAEFDKGQRVESLVCIGEQD